MEGWRERCSLKEGVSGGVKEGERAVEGKGEGGRLIEGERQNGVRRETTKEKKLKRSRESSRIRENELIDTFF